MVLASRILTCENGRRRNGRPGRTVTGASGQDTRSHDKRRDANQGCHNRDDVKACAASASPSTCHWRRCARRAASWERRSADAVAVTVAVKRLACNEQTGHLRWSEVAVRGGVESPTIRISAGFPGPMRSTTGPVTRPDGASALLGVRSARRAHPAPPPWEAKGGKPGDPQASFFLVPNCRGAPERAICMLRRAGLLSTGRGR
jgi:hypothetical protein